MNRNYSPLVSTIIPYYNPRFDYFQEAIESVLSQSYKNWELIIVNDGSNEKSQSLLENYISELKNKRICVVNLEKNYGLFVARNKGIDLAKGEIVTFLDADDLHLPWYYEEIIKGFNENRNSDILFVGHLSYLSLVGIKKFCLTADYSSNILNKIKNAEISMCQQLVLKKDVLKVVRYDTSFQCTGDTDLILQIFNNEALLTKIATLPLTGYLYRMYPSDSRLTLKMELMTKDRVKLINKYEKSEDSLAYKFISSWQERADYWRFIKLLNAYLEHGSIFKYLRDVFTDLHGIKEKIKSIRVLINMIFVCKFLIPVLGVDHLYLKILFGRNGNEYRSFKKIFLDHLNLCSNEEAKFYADKILKKIF